MPKLSYVNFRMPISSYRGDINQDYCLSAMEMGTDHIPVTNKDTALYNNLAKFVLDLQSDVTLEDLLDNGESNGSVMQQNPQECKYQAMNLNDKHREALKQLYLEIKSHQNGSINTHDQSAKRRSAEGSVGFGRPKVRRNSENGIFQDLDGLDENWLMNLASQLGLDKNSDLPELNSDSMKELI